MEGTDPGWTLPQWHSCRFEIILKPDIFYLYVSSGWGHTHIYWAGLQSGSSPGFLAPAWTACRRQSHKIFYKTPSDAPIASFPGGIMHKHFFGGGAV